MKTYNHFAKESKYIKELNSYLKETEDINLMEYEKMIKEFRKKELLEKRKKGESVRLNKTFTKFRFIQTENNFKIKEEIVSKRNSLIKELNEREKRSYNNRNNNLINKNEKLKLMKDEMAKAREKSNLKIKDERIKDEEKRIYIDINLKEKFTKYISNKEKQIKKNKIKDSIENNSNTERGIIRSKEKIIELLNEKKISNFENWYFRKKEENSKRRNFFLTFNSKFSLKEENRNNLQKQKIQQNQKIYNDLNNYMKECNDRRIKTKEENFNYINNNYFTKFKQTMKNRNEINEVKIQEGIFTLNNQIKLINNSLEKSNYIERMKESKIVNSNKDYKSFLEEYKEFSIKLNKIKDTSIQKLNKEKRKELYKELQRKEKEKKKKEEEEKLKALGII